MGVGGWKSVVSLHSWQRGADPLLLEDPPPLYCLNLAFSS